MSEIVDSTPLSSTDVISRLQQSLGEMTPQLQKACSYLLENQTSIGVHSLREIAEAADVKPNTLVRLARFVGFDGFEGFREPFKAEILDGQETFQDRARWLQSLGRGGELNRLLADTAESAITNLEDLFSSIDVAQLKLAARDIVNARTCYVTGIGIANSFARDFAYLSNMAMDNVRRIPHDGLTPIDGLIKADSRDLLIAVTLKPYRKEVVDAVESAQARGLKIIGISNSLASPILQDVTHSFTVQTDTTQFFPSTIALSALLETLVVFVIAESDTKVVHNIEAFHKSRRLSGIHWSEE